MQRALELSDKQIQQLVNTVMNRIMIFTRSIEEQPVDLSDQVEAQQVRALAEPLPDQPGNFDQLLSLVFDQAAPYAINAASPGFMGYIPGGGIFHAAIADLIANSLNRYVGVSNVAPALNQLEANVIRWLCEIVDYPTQARGFLTSGGSLANLSALITARHVRLGEDFSKGVIYISNQAHHCLEKAARLAGFPERNFRVLDVDDHYRLNPQQVYEEILKDRAQGLTPFMIAASAGTTNSGAVDPLPQLADLAKREQLWFHIDGAYGGLFRMTERGRQTLQGLERADSVVLDPHKTLFLPYGTGALLVRNGDDLKATHSSQADYMPTLQEDEYMMDFCELSPELTRPFRGLRIWLPFKMHGAQVFREYLDEKLDLAQNIQHKIEQHPQLELLAPAELSILAFALNDTFDSLEQRNGATKKLMALINSKQRVMLTGTLLKGVYAIRIAVLAYRTHQERMDMLWEDLLWALEVLDNKP